MKILGVDPGLKHTGWAVLDERGKVLAHAVILFPEDGKHPTEQYVKYILEKMNQVVIEHTPDIGVVEQVQWYKKRQSITMPLSHVAGALVGLLVSRGLDVFLLTAVMKNGVKGPKQPKGWTDHEYDAAVLARKALSFVLAERAGDESLLKKLATVGRRRVGFAPKPVPGPVYVDDTGGTGRGKVYKRGKRGTKR